MSFSTTSRKHSELLKIVFFAIIVVNLFLLAWSGWTVLHMPYSGIIVSEDYHVISVDDNSPAARAGIHVGDKIITVNGVDAFSLHSLYSGLRAGDKVDYVVLRDSIPVSYTVALETTPGYRLLSELEAIFVGIIFWLVSLIVWSIAASPAVSTIFFLMGQTTAFLLATGAVSSFTNNTFENYLFSFAMLLLAPLFLHFYLIFPREKRGERSKFLRYAIYGIAATLLLIFILVTFFNVSVPWLVFINSQRLLFTSFVILVALASLFFWHSESSLHTLRQQRLLIVGMLFSVLPLLILSLLPQLLLSHPLVDYIWTFPFLVLLPISYAYAVYKENLGAFDHFLKRGLLYLSSAGLLLGVYFIAIAVLKHLFPASFYEWGHLVAGAIVLIIAIVWGEWLKKSLNRLLDHFFYRHWYDYRSIIQQNSHYLGGTVRLERLAQSLLQNARTMRFLEAALLWGEGDELRSYQSFGYPESIVQSFHFRKDDFIVQKLTNIGGPCLNQRLFTHEPNMLAAMDERSEVFKDGRVQIWVPLIHGSGTLTGILLLGSRLGDEPLDREDWDILETLAGHISLAVENINLVETLRHQLSVMKRIQKELVETKLRLSENRERERLELARLLHDGPIQDIYGVIYQLAIWRKIKRLQDDSELSEVEASLMTIEKQLRFFSSELRPPALDTFGLEGAIRSHFSHLRESYPDINFHLDMVQLGELISEGGKLALFRIYQESMRNILKHAQAKDVWVRLFREADQIVLEVEDNGVGFVIPEEGWMEPARRGHFGLLGVCERADSVGGKLSVVSSPGEGTLIRVSIPIESMAEQASDVVA